MPSPLRTDFCVRRAFVAVSYDHPHQVALGHLRTAYPHADEHSLTLVEQVGSHENVTVAVENW